MVLPGLVKKNPVPALEKIKIEVDISPGTPVIKADRELLEKAVLNLLENAREAMPAGGTVSLRAGKVNAEAPGGGKAAEFLKISIADEGKGISPETLEKAFEPCFTTKEKSLGAGMGLSMAYGIARYHGGWIEGGRLPSGGSEFSLFFPVV